MAGKAPLIAAVSAASVAVVAASAAVIVVTMNANRDEAPTETNDVAAPRVAYATEGVTVVEDPDELSRMVQEMYGTQRDMMALSYKNDAFSENGRDFQCYIANALGNEYDMFIAIYADADYSEELFLSQLLRPGSAFERLTLERALEKGDHTVYVAFTQVEEDDDGEQAIHGQSKVTMTFHVA